MESTKFYITKAKYDALIEEIKYLEGEGATQLAEILASSPGSGMGRPNDLPAHVFAGELMGYLQDIKTVIRHAEIIDDLIERDQDPNLVVLGSTVSVQYDGEDEVVEYTILGSRIK